MTHWRAVSHTVAYMWKPVKPRWQTVWYAAIRSGGGGLVRRFGQGRPASLRGRELRGGEQLWSSRSSGEAATGGTLHMPVVGGKQGWMFLLIFIHADHNHESPNTGENIRSLHIVLLWVICLLSLFPSISSPSILKVLYSFPLSGPPNLICVRHGWLPTAYTLYLSPFSLFPLATISLYPSPKAPLHVHFPASFLLTATLCPRPETVWSTREGDYIILIQIRPLLGGKEGAINNFSKITFPHGDWPGYRDGYPIRELVFCPPLISLHSGNCFLCFCTLKEKKKNHSSYVLIFLFISTPRIFMYFCQDESLFFLSPASLSLLRHSDTCLNLCFGTVLTASQGGHIYLP